jgi:hypothetical protein
MSADTDLIRRYMAGVIRSKDGRGRHLNERALYERLLPGTTPTIARATAAAVRRVGEGIARIHSPEPV